MIICIFSGNVSLHWQRRQYKALMTTLYEGILIHKTIFNFYQKYSLTGWKSGETFWCLEILIFLILITSRLSSISSVHSQKGLNTVQISIENQKGKVSMYTIYGNSGLLVLNGTSLNSINALLALSRRYYTLPSVALGAISWQSSARGAKKTTPIPLIFYPKIYFPINE